VLRREIHFVTALSQGCCWFVAEVSDIEGMRPRVLVVDDDIEFAELLQFNLQEDGFESFLAHNGVHALRVARARLPDVILLDVMLPDLDGLSVCEILNRQPSTHNIPVIIISALNETWPQTRRSNAQFVRFFTKPVDLKLLRATVRSAVAKGREDANRHSGELRDIRS
jgi:DNA-binding response OmpR family regulator